MALCRYCEKELPPGRRWFCNESEARAHERIETSSLARMFKELAEKEPVKEKKILITEQEQRTINKQVNTVLSVKFESRHIKPGDPEFDEIVKTLTPPDRIKSRSYIDGFEKRMESSPTALGQGRIG